MGPPLPPNPCLVAILLIINAKSSPYFVFHYPAQPPDDLSSTKGISKAYHGDGKRDRNRNVSSGLGGWNNSNDDSGDDDGNECKYAGFITSNYIGQ